MTPLENAFEWVLSRLAAHKTVVWSVIVGFVVAMFVFADHSQITGVIESLYAIGFGIFGLLLFLFGFNKIRAAYQGKGDGWGRDDDHDTASGQVLGMIMGAIAALFGGAMVFGATIGLLGYR